MTGRRAEREYNRFLGDIGQTKMQQYLEGGGSPSDPRHARGATASSSSREVI